MSVELEAVTDSYDQVYIVESVDDYILHVCLIKRKSNKYYTRVAVRVFSVALLIYGVFCIVKMYCKSGVTKRGTI